LSPFHALLLLNVDALSTCLLRAGPFLFRANTVREEGTYVEQIKTGQNIDQQD